MKHVHIYWNSKKKLFSIRDPKTRKVIDWKDTVYLQSCFFKVSESGRQRVLKTKSKNVHAYVDGYLIDELPDRYEMAGLGVSYNPYENTQFQIKKSFDENKANIYDAQYLICSVSNQNKPIIRPVKKVTS